MRSQPPHAKLGHVGERLADAAAKQEASQLLVQAGDVQVPHEGLGAGAMVTHPVTLAHRDLRERQEEGEREEEGDVEEESRDEGGGGVERRGEEGGRGGGRERGGEEW